MNEKLLQFIWRFQYFNTRQLQSIDGETIKIIQSGTLNQNQGPDFLEAKISIGNTILVGHIELHVKSSDWMKHNHSNDHNYSNVILHVVWQHDKNIIENIHFPTLELEPLVASVLLEKYAALMMDSPAFVPCQDSLLKLSTLGWINWMERLALERLERKCQQFLLRLVELNGDWNGLLWEELAYNFGLKVNAEHFRSIAKSIPWQVIAKQNFDLLYIEALLFGQGGLLDGSFSDDYPNKLQKEYYFLKTKYKLFIPQGKLAFLRMRPQNFPTIRLSQLATLLQQTSFLFSRILELKDLEELRQLFNISASQYWEDHFLFDKETDNISAKNIGETMIENIMINTIVPILFAYGNYFQNEEIKNRALQLLIQCHAEKNNIVDSWRCIGIVASNALESQSLIELYKKYCTQKRCLVCAVGNRILNNNR